MNDETRTSSDYLCEESARNGDEPGSDESNRSSSCSRRLRPSSDAGPLSGS